MKSKLQTLLGYVREFGTKSFMTDGKVLTFRICHTTVSHSQKSQIQQHILTNKHTTSLSKVNSTSEITSHNQLSHINDNNPHDQQTFNFDLNKTLICANISRNKLSIPIFKDFLSKYTGYHIPSRKHLSNKQTPPLFQKTIQKIRDLISTNFIWVSIDETTDSLGRHPTAVIIGILSPSDYQPPFLLKLSFLEKVNGESIAKLFINSMLLLWPTGIEYNRVLLFISDAAPYMNKSYNSLKLTFPKMAHVNCVAHNLHRLCETIRNKSPNADFLVSNMKKTFKKSPSRITLFKEKLPLVPLPPSPIITRWGTWLQAVSYMCQHFDKLKDLFLENDLGDSASIDNCTSIFLNNDTMQEVLEITHNYFFLIQIITNLQRQDISLKDSLELFENAKETIISVNCSISEIVNEKFNQIYEKNK